jgi:hypothetical protein
MSKLKVILDTNVLLVSISSKLPYHWIFEKLINGVFDIGITFKTWWYKRNVNFLCNLMKIKENSIKSSPVLYHYPKFY